MGKGCWLVLTQGFTHSFLEEMAPELRLEGWGMDPAEEMWERHSQEKAQGGGATGRVGARSACTPRCGRVGWGGWELSCWEERGPG